MANLKVFLFATVALGIGTTAASAELVWEKKEIELHPAVGEESVVGHFKYENKGDKKVSITSVVSSCGCTAASTNKDGVAPGEKGEITATFQIGNRIGTQQKAITVSTDDPAQPTVTLQLKVEIPQVLDLQPAFVFWQSGEEPKAKTIVAKAGKDVSIEKLQVASSSPDFTAKVEPGAGEGEYKIQVQPKATKEAASANLTITPDLATGKTKVFTALARVLPATAAPSSPAGAATAAEKAAGEASKGKVDVCALLTSAEIESVQGEPIKETKASGMPGGPIATSDCYFLLPTSSNSISISVMQKGDGPNPLEVKDFWARTFKAQDEKQTTASSSEENGKKTDGEEEKEKAVPPQKIEGLGDEALWVGTRVGGQLYVLKGDALIRISVGGGGDQESKIKKSRDLAEMILKRL